jgi:O-antigen/teichoic acid export membrane protein
MTVAVMLVNLISSAIVVRRLSATEYGAWVIISSFATYSVLLDLGISQALVRLIATERGRPGGRPLAYLGTALRAYAVLGVLAFLVVLVGGLIYLRSTGLDVQPGTPLFAANLILAVGALIAIPALVPTAVLAGYERYDIVNIAAFAAIFVPTLAATAYFLLLHGNVVVLALSATAVVVLAAALRGILALRIEPDLFKGLAQRSPGEFSTLLSVSLAFFVQATAIILIWRIDPLLVGVGVSLAAVATYSLAQRIAAGFQDLGAVAMSTLMPSFARTHASGDMDRARHGVVVLTRATMVGVLPATLLIMLESRALLLAWVGAPFDQGAPIATVLVAAVGLAHIRGPSLVALQAFHSVRWLAMLAMAEAVSKVVLSIALVLWLKEIGVAIGTLLPAIVFTVFVYLRTCMRQMELGLAELFGMVSLRAGAAALVAAASFLLPIPGHYLLGATVHGLAFAVVYAALLMLTSSGTERAAARTLATSAWRTRLVDAR